MTKENKKVLKWLKQSIKHMEKEHNAEIVSALVDFGHDGNKCTPYRFINDDVFNFHFKENFKDDCEPEKFVELYVSLTNFEEQIKGIFDNDVYDKTDKNKNYEILMKQHNKIHTIMQELFNKFEDFIYENYNLKIEPEQIENNHS
jgi:hypothetical protein